MIPISKVKRNSYFLFTNVNLKPKQRFLGWDERDREKGLKQVTSMYSVSSRKKKWTITNWCFTPHKHPFKKKSILFVFFRWWKMKNIGEGGSQESNFPIYYLGLNSWNCHAQALPQCVRKPESMILIKWPYSWPLD